MKNLLIGRWKFEASQRVFNDTWTDSGEHVKDMTWEFDVEYISKSKQIGTIVEQAPNREPVPLKYMYNSENKLLTIEIGINKDGSFEVDEYSVTTRDDGGILLSMPEFRYLLSDTERG